MQTVSTTLSALRTSLGRRIRVPCSVSESAVDAETSDESPIQRATRGIGRFEPTTYPPFETVTIGSDDADARPHGVVVLNDGPKRRLSLSVRGAGTGESFTGSRLLESGGVVQLLLRQPDRYSVTVSAPGRPAYGVDIDPAWFGRDAGVTNVRVQSDGYVRYDPV